jgi:hypothetical protein
MALHVPQTLDHLPSDETTQRAQLQTLMNIWAKPHPRS